MRSEGDIRQRLKQVLFRHRKKLIERNFKQKPFTCAHNALTTLDGVEVGVCAFEGEGGPTGRLCDVRHEHGAFARTCLQWEALATADEVKAEFQDFIENADRGELALEYPDVVALMWVLGEGGAFPLDEDATVVESPEPTWLDKLLRRG